MDVKSLVIFFTFLFFLSACNTSLQKYEIINPPLFSFIDIDPNNNDIEYIERMKKYDKIIQSSLIPVFIIDQNSLPDKLITSLETISISKLYGLYVPNSIDPSWPDEFIFINIRFSSETILTTFFHEYQHYMCKKTKCYCSDIDYLSEDERIISGILKEKHALKNEIRASLEMNDPYLIKNSILMITHYILYGRDYTYKVASLCVADSKIWNKALNVLLEKEKVR